MGNEVLTLEMPAEYGAGAGDGLSRCMGDEELCLGLVEMTLSSPR